MLTPGATIIEATSGNTGIGLAMVGRAKGYRVKIVAHDKVSAEKLSVMKHFGAEVILTRSDLKPNNENHFVNMALTMAKQFGYFYADQFNNLSNYMAHFDTTAPELWAQTNGEVDAIFCGIGSGGTVRGIAEFMKSKNRNIKIIAADPIGSIYFSEFHKKPMENGEWKIEGIGSNFIPGIFDGRYLDEVTRVSDSDAFQTSRMILEKEGIDVGLSSGAIINAALEYCRAGEYRRVVAISPDAGERYISKISANS